MPLGLGDLNNLFLLVGLGLFILSRNSVSNPFAVCICFICFLFLLFVFFWAPIVRKRALNARLLPLEYRIHARFIHVFIGFAARGPGGFRGGSGGLRGGGFRGGGGSGLGGFRGGSGGVIIPFRTTCVFACAMLT